jgi:iduronate 2-sulfatase
MGQPDETRSTSGRSVAPRCGCLCQRPQIQCAIIAEDDLRNDLGCLGNREVLSPHLGALAARGRLLHKAYCQQALCNPSRSSLLTGRRPDTLSIWDLPTHFRDTV